MASHKKRFFYTIVTNHYFLVDKKYVQMKGYGITDGPKSRVRKYSTASGGEQEFRHLWYSPKYQVMELEKILKKRISSDAALINGEEVEWLSTTSDISIENLTSMIEEIIKEFKLDVRRIKSDYLPFNASEWQQGVNHYEIELQPDLYLEPSLIVDKKRKK